MIFGSTFDAGKLREQLAEIEKQAADPGLWSNPQKSQQVMRQKKRLENVLATETDLVRRSEDISAYFDLGRASAAAWIYTIARNLRVDRLRGDKRAAQYAPLEMVEPESPESPDDVLNASERSERVRGALKQLSQDQIRVVQLSFFEGRAHGDIAALLNLPLGTVKSRLAYGLAQLRKDLV